MPADRSAMSEQREGSKRREGGCTMNVIVSRSVLGRVLVGLFVVLSLVAGTGAAFAQSVKNIVLVHGAFVDGSSWAKVIPILQAKGYNVTAVQLPLTSYNDDVATTQRAIARLSGPTILVGHSWAGVVITEAGMDPKVVGLVYVAAFAPDQGEAVGELGKKYPPPPALAAPQVDEKGFMTLTVDAFKKFGSDLPESEASIAAATQGPISAASFSAQVSGVAWKTKPTWYVVSTLDQAISPDEERFFAKRMKATTTELKASHVSMLSQPKAVAAVIMDAATKTQNAAKTAGD
jgi:pimeloyl-ACP methyl ester carboxylesterase